MVDVTRSLTTRLALQRWSADGDTQQRVDFDNDNAQLEQLALIGLQGTLSARPAAGVPRRLYYATDNGWLYYDDGTTWLVLKVAGAEDTGWTNIALRSGFQSTGTTCQARRRNGVVFLRGLVRKSDGTAFAASSGFTVADLSNTFAPGAADVHVTVAGTDGSRGGKLVLGADNTVNVYTGPTSGTYYALTGVSYLQDS